MSIWNQIIKAKRTNAISLFVSNGSIQLHTRVCVCERTICLHCLIRSFVYNILFHFHHFQFRSCYLHNTHPSYMHHDCEVVFAHLVNALFICNRNHNSLVLQFFYILPMVCSMNNFHIWLVFTEFGRSNVLQRFWWGFIYYQKSCNKLWRSVFSSEQKRSSNVR